MTRTEYLPRTLATFAALLLIGCSSVPQPVTKSDRLRARNEGYSLLYNLVSDESGVNKVLILKHANDDITAEIQQLSKYLSEQKDQLDAFQKIPKAQLDYQSSGLPTAEQRARELESGTESKALLLSAGKEFEQELLLTQIQATGYMSHLARSLIELETDSNRKSFLDKLAEKADEHHKRLKELLAGL